MWSFLWHTLKNIILNYMSISQQWCYLIHSWSVLRMTYTVYKFPLRGLDNQCGSTKKATELQFEAVWGKNLPSLFSYFNISGYGQPWGTQYIKPVLDFIPCLLNWHCGYKNLGHWYQWLLYVHQFLGLPSQ